MRHDWQDCYESLDDMAADLIDLLSKATVERIKKELENSCGVWVTSSDCTLLVTKDDDPTFKFSVVCWNDPKIKDETYRLLALPTFSTGE